MEKSIKSSLSSKTQPPQVKEEDHTPVVPSSPDLRNLKSTDFAAWTFTGVLACRKCPASVDLLAGTVQFDPEKNRFHSYHMCRQCETIYILHIQVSTNG